MDVDPAKENPPDVPRRHEVLWFPRGDVVLSTDTYLFKVHKDILSLQSSVFKDMFDLPTIGDGDIHIGADGGGFVQDLYDGLPMVKLVGDNGKEVAHLLRAAYERQYYYRDDHSTPLEIITTLLVLSTKYDFKHIRKDVILQISKLYPMTLIDYDAIDKDDSDMFGDKRAECHFPLLKALYTANVEALLPILCYACSDYAVEAILNEANYMDVRCVHTVVKGRDRLAVAAGKLVANLPENVRTWASVCPDKRNCPYLARVSGSAGFLGCADLKNYEGQKMIKRCVEGICEGCTERLGDKINEKREKIWDDVPSFFGFPGWHINRQRLNEACSN